MRQLYVRYSYVNPIIEMLCSSFDYYLEVEESYLGDSLVKVSKESKADYISWRLMKDKNMKSILTNILVLETKHLNKLTLKEIAQTIGYYCISKCNDNQAGVAVVLNQSEKKVLNLDLLHFCILKTLQEDMEYKGLYFLVTSVVMNNS